MPQSATPLTLVVHKGPHSGRSFSLSKDVLTIGRDAAVDIVIDDRGVSRSHARLVFFGGRWMIEDLGSSNGTFVDGVRITAPVVLAGGAVVGLGPNVALGVHVGPGGGVATAHGGGHGNVRWGVAGAAAVLGLLLVAAAVAAYALWFNVPSPPSLPEEAMAFPSGGPAVTIHEPAPGAVAPLGTALIVFATARDARKVTRLDLWIDDTLAAQQASPVAEGVTPLSLVYRWTPAAAGDYYLLVRAYNSDGVTGESPLVYVTVTGNVAQPEQAFHVVQSGEDLDWLASQAGVAPQDVVAANPGLVGPLMPGQAVVVPVVPPAVEPLPSATATTAPPTVQGAATGKAGGGPAGGNLGGQGGVLGPPPIPNAPLVPPTLLGLKATDCKVTVAWEDNSEGEDGFGVLRAPKGQPAFELLQPLVGKLAGTGKTGQFVDTVPGPGTYVYAVAAGTASGSQARSNPATIVVAVTPACAQPAGYRQVVFEPTSVKAGQYLQLALYFEVGNGVGRRLPISQWAMPGDWNALRQSIPVFLKPGDSLPFMVMGEAHMPNGSAFLGMFSRSFTAAELTPDRTWQGQAAKGLDVTYRLWLEDVVWGKGTSILVPAPYGLRLATTASELDILKGCAPGKCDPKAARSLRWEWDGKSPPVVNGYLLLRSYDCGGKEIHYTDIIIANTQKGRILSPADEPIGCVARYEVSAFGPAGVSPPSQPLSLPPGNTGNKLAFMFEKFSVNGVLAEGQGLAQVAFIADDQLSQSQSMLFPAGAAAGGAQAFDMSRQLVNGKMPNNGLVLGVVEGNSMHIGFNAQVGNSTCVAQQILSVNPGQTWDSFVGQKINIKSLDGRCEVDVHIGQAGPPPNEEGKGQQVSADMKVRNVFAAGNDLYVSLRNQGPDHLPNHHLQVEAWWAVEKPKAGGSSEILDRLEEPQQMVLWPAGAEDLVLKVGSTNTRLYLKSTDPAAQVLFHVVAKPVDFADPWLANNAAGSTVSLTPIGFGCSRDEQCESAYCADRRFCAPQDGTGEAGDYCHHDNHCASGLCVCPDGWESGAGGFCKGWKAFDPLAKTGRCSAQAEDGTACDADKDCVSGYCADGRTCAPRDGTGKEGDYCHHDNHCQTGLCMCPDGWEGGRGFCRGWMDFTAAGTHGTCSASLPSGSNCASDRDCQSGYCADGKKCAPKDGTGRTGAYCHHDNHCASGMCDCPGEDLRVMGGASFCPDWKTFNTAVHGICRAKGDNGAGCTRDQQCLSGHCADGKKCAPKDGTGRGDDYCHHNNHCQNRVCDCPEGTDLFGFCIGWEDFTSTDHATCQVY